MDVDCGNDGHNAGDDFSGADIEGDVAMETGSSTQRSAQDRDIVDKMLTDLTQSQSNKSSSAHPPSSPLTQVVETSQPTQDLGAKRRRAGSSNAATSSPPPMPSPPHKRVNFQSSPAASPDRASTSRGGAVLRNRSAVPDDAPGVRGRGGSSRGRARGGRR
jgi:hypothetical protein